MAHELFRMLESDHEEVRDILDRLGKIPGGQVKKKDQLFMQLKQSLIPHLKGEEQHFYPLLLEEQRIRKLTMEAIEEHRVAELVLKELDKLDKAADEWDAKLRVFREIVQHHVEEEEEELFEAAEDVLDEEQLDDIMTAFREGKEKLKKKYQ